MFITLVSVLSYSLASVYFISCNFESASQSLLAAVSKVPRVANSGVFTTLDDKFRTVVLPSRPLKALSSATLSLFTYPTVVLASGMMETLTYVAAFFALCYLSISQSDSTLEFVTTNLRNVIQLIKDTAKSQIQPQITDSTHDSDTLETKEKSAVVEISEK